MGLLGSLGKLVGRGLKVAGGVATSALPGGSVVKEGAMAIAGKIVKRNARKIVAVGAAAGAGTVALARKHPVAVMAGAAGAGAAGTAALMAMHGGAARVGRRMNPGNFRATRRALRRIEYAARSYDRIFRVIHRPIKGTRVKARFKRRRKAA